MGAFNALESKLAYWLNSSDKTISIKGISNTQWCLVAHSRFHDLLFRQPLVIVCSDLEEAEMTYDSLKLLNNVLFYPGLNQNLYSAILSSETSMLARWSTLNKICALENPIIVTTWDALYLKIPPKSFFEENSFLINKDDIISPGALAERLILTGYFPASTVEEPGTFSRRGEIFDIYPINNTPKRIHYFDDLIENIFEIDLETQKTIKNLEYSSLTISPGSGLLLKEDYISNLRSNIPQPQPAFKEKYEQRKKIFSDLSRGQFFENYPIFSPLFFKKSETLLNYLPVNTIINYINYDSGLKNFELYLARQSDDFDLSSKDVENGFVLPAPEHLIEKNLTSLNLKQIIIETLDLDINTDFKHEIHLHLEPLRNFLRVRMIEKGGVPESKFDFIKMSLQIIHHTLKHSGFLFIVYRTQGALDELKFLIKENGLDEINSRITYVQGNLAEGFYYKNENIVLLSEADFFAQKLKKTKAKKTSSKDLFAEQLSTLKINDYVIHRDHGIGIYKGLETISVGDQQNDYLVLIYEGNDKIYVPVYKLNLIQKHADGTTGAKVASLKSKKFAELKQKARQSVKKLAFDLIKLQAERKLRGGYSFSAPDHLYKEFELSFQFEPTPDQEKAVLDVIEDMQKQLPMDRLICGDVGFGKTEVAMRASMMAVLDKKQVVVLVPTTVLALQHYHSFKKRFENFPVNIDFISRFKTPKEKSETLKKVKDGSIDILLGTHSILSDKVEFYDLGLLIIDEEHRFGVGHKEKLKVLKSTVDVLTMTATPIPRTLQLSFLGIRDLSLIQTAPPRRQAIKTYIIKEDDQTIKSAIEKELTRGGQIYFVHNRVHDIEEYELYLKKLVPSARISVTHGQMPERELEKKINDFYAHKSDILLATTIIESGIDIPNANTMIIDRADTYGLAQLHQLRGRIGRSDRKAYAYFIVPENKILSETAQKRLHALQTYAEMGSGFALASSDMEIRGAGDILGAEQSGHIEAIGLEFYMDLLQEAIQEIKGEKRIQVKNIEIQAPFSAFIPNKYISDNALRLKYYKRLSNSVDIFKLEEVISEINDVFGITPKELEALYSILKSRIHLKYSGIKLLKISGNQIYLYFEEDILNSNDQLRDNIFKCFFNKPKLYKLNPDNSIVCYFKENLSHETLLEFAKHIAGQIGVC
jgi:transcription-repair coupling factor (superfamily II helicase)